MKVALVQINSTDNLKNNYKKFLYFLELAKINNTELVLFPESLFYIGNMDNYKNVAIEIKEDYLKRVYDKIKEFQVDVILGGVPYIDSGNLFNRSIYVNKQGNVATYYDKIHLFSVDGSKSSLNEADFLKRGEKAVTFKKGEFTLGLSICYDLRFPELYRKLIDKGSDVLIVTAAFTYKTGKLHWKELLKARAIENQSFVLGVNQVGKHNNFGHSYGVTSVVKPSGEIISLNDKDEDILFYTLEKKEVEHYRNWIPSLKNRIIDIC